MTPVTALYGRKASDSTLNWFTVITMMVGHVLCVAAVFYIETGAILAMLAMWFVTSSLGLGMDITACSRTADTRHPSGSSTR